MLVNVVFKGLSKLLLNVVSPVVLLVDVFVIDFAFLLDWRGDKLLIENHDATFADCSQHNIAFALALGSLHYVFKRLEFRIVDFYLLSEFEDYWLVNDLPIAIQ